MPCLTSQASQLVLNETFSLFEMLVQIEHERHAACPDGRRAARVRLVLGSSEMNYSGPAVRRKPRSVEISNAQIESSESDTTNS